MQAINALFQQLDFRHCKIKVAGDLMLDQYWLGDTSRISPEAPVPVLKVNNTEARLGGAANTALNAATLGASVSLYGIHGNDVNGIMLQRLLKEKNILDHCISTSSTPTISKLRMISRGQQLVRADFEKPFAAEDIRAFEEKIINELEGTDLILLSDYNKGSLENCQNIIQAANKAGIKVIADPKGDDFSKYKGAYCITPNLGEFETIVGKCTDEQDMFTKADKIIRELSLNALLLTRSEKGMTLFLADGSHHHFNARTHEVYDVTGAGDTVIASFAVAIANGIAIDQAALLANTAAGIAVSRMGATSVTPLELKLALENAGSQPRGITTPDQLKELVEFEKNLGKTIVFTNGCFDILHSGHANYLSEAGTLGDRLIVAINSDDSVKRLKGSDRPINTIDDRMAVISSLKSVDWVVSFDEDTPEALLEIIKPDILVKGGDYSIDQVVGADIVRKYGGEIKVLSEQAGMSTSNIIDSIKTR